VNTQQQTRAVATRADVERIMSDVAKHRADFVAFLPVDYPPDRFVAMAKRAVLENAELATCTSTSVLRALREAAISGLELDGDHGTLIVRQSKGGKPVAAFEASYKGMITLALRSGFVKAVDCQCVHAADAFEITFGTAPSLVHRPALTGDPGPVVAAYAIATLSSDVRLVEVLTATDIARIRAMSPAGDKGPWGTWDDEMSRKSAVRRLLKKLPSTIVTPMRASGMTSQQLLRGPDAPAELTPEELYAIESNAIAAISDAESLAELDTRWSAVKLEFQQRGASVTVRVEAAAYDRRETLRQASEQ
jgi:recombination protein RecT